MSAMGVPPTIGSLQQRLVNVADRRGIPVLRLRRSVAHTVVGQMLPAGVVKGGAAVRLRVDEEDARLTADFDVSPAAVLTSEKFVAEFEKNLATGWPRDEATKFTGALVTKTPATPVGVPPDYVMKPYEVKLRYRSKSWCTVVFELGHDEAGSTDHPDLRMPGDLLEVFDELGLPTPAPIPVMSVAHQAAQKLHACTGGDTADGTNARAHDLVDLQILDRVEGIDPADLAAVAPRLFAYRNRQIWPPTVVVHPGWDTLYDAAAEGLGVLGSVDEAVTWANDLIARTVEP